MKRSIVLIEEIISPGAIGDINLQTLAEKIVIYEKTADFKSASV